MANNGLSLCVYTSVMNATPAWVEDIANYAVDYQHSIRLLGGYWTATWKLYRDAIGAAKYEQWRSNRYFYHFVEQYRGQTTWEGSIETIQSDDDKGLLDITAYGYVHSIQNQYNSTTDTGTTDANAWIDLMVATDCEFVETGYLETNTLQCYKAGTDKVWDEMLKVVELAAGSAPFGPWQIGVYQDRRLYYNAVSLEPVGYVPGGSGIRWRMDAINDLCNSVTVRYTDETGTPAADITATRQESIDRYGLREIVLTRTYLHVDSATSLAYAYMRDHCWPRMRAVGCGRNIRIYDSIGCDKAKTPWLVLPGIFADRSIQMGGQEYADWLTDKSHFLVDEVVASESGVQLRTSQWTETDALEAYYDYLADAPKGKGGGKGKKKRRRSTGGSSSGGSGGSNTDTGTTQGGGGRTKDLPY